MGKRSTKEKMLKYTGIGGGQGRERDMGEIIV